MKDVHTSHCCDHCGCKYGRDDCTVATGKAPAEYPCEACEGVREDWESHPLTIELKEELKRVQRQLDRLLNNEEIKCLIND